MRKFIAIATAAVMAMSLAACGSSSTATTTAAASGETQAAADAETTAASTGDAQYTIKLCHEQTDGDPIDEGCDKWAELIAEKTNGAVKMEVYPQASSELRLTLSR